MRTSGTPSLVRKATQSRSLELKHCARSYRLTTSPQGSARLTPFTRCRSCQPRIWRPRSDQLSRCLRGLDRRSEMACEECLPRAAFEIRDLDVPARIDVHRLFPRPECVEEGKAALAWRHGVFPLKYELDRDGDRFRRLLEHASAGA